jgi:TatD DNase family protein
MNTPIFETHAHYDHKQYDSDREKLLLSLKTAGVGAVLNVGCDMRASRASVELAKKYPFVYATVGVHPHDAKTLTEKNIEELILLTKNDKVVAFGEIGLDFYRNFSPPDIQRKWFKRQLEAAWELQLPVIIHSRDADDEVYDILFNSPHRRGVIHAFPGDAALAQRYVNLGFYLGIGGVLTYDKTGRLKTVVHEIPLERMLLETDCPYLTPAPHRGKRNESGYLKYVAEAIAGIKGVSAETVRRQTYANACELLGLPCKKNIRVI